MEVLEAAQIQIRMDEPSLSLYEFERIRPDSRGFNRYQQFRVIRNDRPAYYEADMGPVEHFPHGPLYIPGGVITFSRLYFDGKTLWEPQDTTWLPREVPYAYIRSIESEYRVGQLIDAADILREDGPTGLYKPESRDFARDFTDSMDDVYKWRTGHSTFGPGGSLVRSL